MAAGAPSGCGGGLPEALVVLAKVRHQLHEASGLRPRAHERPGGQRGEVAQGLSLRCPRPQTRRALSGIVHSKCQLGFG